MYNSLRPIAAFLMSDYEKLVDFGRGKDKAPRKRRNGSSASLVDKTINSLDRAVEGAKSGFKTGFESNPVKKKIVAYAKKNADGKKLKDASGKVMKGLKVEKSGFRKVIENGKVKIKGGNLVKGVTSATGSIWKSGKVGKAGLIGAGVLGTGAVAGAGYGAYKMLKKKRSDDD